MLLSTPSHHSPQVMTVQGPVPYDRLGITDAHNHVWINPIPGVAEGSPVINQFDLIVRELAEYKQKGGGTILDCQPGGCGRDGNRLRQLSKASMVNIIACTGFHRELYYPGHHWLWRASSQEINDFLTSELELGLAETLDTPSPVRAGFIKIALEATWNECPLAALEGVAAAACHSKAMLAIHTEKGALAEKACIYLSDRGVLPHQLMLCHMDKRPDLSLHKALASFGVLLEYDTFYRPKYSPATNLWPLIEHMVGVGLSNQVTLATDMADPALYHHLGGGPGLASLPGEIQDTLKRKGYPEEAISQMLGESIARRLAGIK